MKEFLVIFESDLDYPKWMVLRAKFRSFAIRRAQSMLKWSVGSDRFQNYSVSVVVSR